MRNPNPPNFVVISVLTTITIVFWVFLGVYRVLVASPEPSVSENILAPISPDLNTDILDTIDKRVYFEDAEIVEFDSIQDSQPEENINTDLDLVPQIEEENTTVNAGNESGTNPTEETLPTENGTPPVE